MEHGLFTFAKSLHEKVIYIQTKSCTKIAQVKTQKSSFYLDSTPVVFRNPNIVLANEFMLNYRIKLIIRLAANLRACLHGTIGILAMDDGESR